MLPRQLLLVTSLSAHSSMLMIKTVHDGICRRAMSCTQSLSVTPEAESLSVSIHVASPLAPPPPPHAAASSSLPLCAGASTSCAREGSSRRVATRAATLEERPHQTALVVSGSNIHTGRLSVKGGFISGCYKLRLWGRTSSGAHKLGWARRRFQLVGPAARVLQNEVFRDALSVGSTCRQDPFLGSLGMLVLSALAWRRRSN